jgi:hypothetical protein
MGTRNQSGVHQVKKIIAGLLFIIGMQAHASCVASFSPPTAIFSGSDGVTKITVPVTLTVTCTRGESFTITTTAASFQSIAPVSFYKDATGVQPLYGFPLTTFGAATATPIPLYIVMSNPGGIPLGAVTGSAMVTVTGAGGSVSSAVIALTGRINSVCAVGDAMAGFGTVEAGTNPVVPVTVPVTCSKGALWTMTEATLGTVTIGTTSNTAQVYQDSGKIRSLMNTSVTGSGTGVGQSQLLYVGLNGPSGSGGINGTGPISGTVQIQVSY